ncbi:glycosyltransferase involved in cell wall biosynthesis [Paenibacillus castaneae]|uniref:glycosyltransferase n=1 Tax=Paenibacillus castaneae TaxID=474957 RepID=UPI000C9C8A45|nr:glycosyltransferase [Paenibacillus castaneae]NIK76097.1 glycosyltransferase involved in cell wall biosynthesis [Paenibacillus castaneae]
MKSLLIASYDMEVGGVERSLAGLLDEFDYSQYDVNLMLYRHQGDFMSLLTGKAKLLDEIPQYATFRQSIGGTFRNRQHGIGISRILAKVHAALNGKIKGIEDTGYHQMQLMWKYALPFLPQERRHYDVAISYLWPHYYVAEKVSATTKIAWIHTDFSTIATNPKLDLEMWSKFDYIMAVSEACKQSFLEKYGSLNEKVVVLENIMSPASISTMAAEAADTNPMIKDSRFKLLTVGRLSHAKGIDNAVKAMKQLADKGYDDLVWYIVGYGGDEAMIRKLIAGFGLENCFILLGKQTNPYPYMSECDLYVQPSRYEGKAVTVTEAKILGKPIVITNYPTAASQVTHERDGFITELSVEGIAAGIEKLYLNNELRARIADNCKQHDYSNGYELNRLYELIGAEGRSIS